MVFSLFGSLEVYAGSNILDNLNAKVLFIRYDENNHEAIIDNQTINFKIVNKTVMVDLAVFCEHLNLECEMLKPDDYAIKMAVMKSYITNDYCQQRLNELEEAHRKRYVTAIVRKHEALQSSYVEFCSDRKTINISSALYGLKKMSLSEKVISDNGLWVPLDTLLFAFDCEFYVNSNKELVIKEPSITVNDFANIDFIKQGGSMFDLLNIEGYTGIAINISLGEARAYKFLDNFFNFSWNDLGNVIDTSKYETSFNQEVAFHLCVSSEEELEKKIDYLSRKVELDCKYGIVQDTLNKQIIADGENIFDAVINNRQDDIAHARSSEIGLLHTYKNELKNYCSAQMMQDSFDNINRIAKVVISPMTSKVTEDKPVESKLGGTFLMTLDSASKTGSAYARMLQISPAETRKINDFFQNKEIQAYIDQKNMYALKTISDEVGVYNSHDRISEKMSSILAENIRSAFLEEYSDQTIDFMVNVSGIETANSRPIETLLESILRSSKLYEAEKIGWNFLYQFVFRNYFQNRDDLKVSQNTWYVQLPSIEMYQNLYGKSSEISDVETFRQDLMVALKSGYIARVLSLNYLSENMISEKTAESITNEASILAGWLANLDTADVGLNLETYRKYFLETKTSNEYLIKNLFGEDVLDTNGEQEHPVSGMPKYIFYSDGETLYKYDVINQSNNELLLKKSYTVDDGLTSYPFGSIYDVTYKNGYLFFLSSAGQDGIGWSNFLRASTDGSDVRRLAQMSDSTLFFDDNFIVIADYRNCHLMVVDYQGNILKSYPKASYDEQYHAYSWELLNGYLEKWQAEYIGNPPGYYKNNVCYIDNDNRFREFDILNDTYHVYDYDVIPEKNIYESYTIYTNDSVILCADYDNLNAQNFCLYSKSTGNTQKISTKDFGGIYSNTIVGSDNQKIYVYLGGQYDKRGFSGGYLYDCNDGSFNKVNSKPLTIGYESKIYGNYLYTAISGGLHKINLLDTSDDTVIATGLKISSFDLVFDELEDNNKDDSQIVSSQVDEPVSSEIRSLPSEVSNSKYEEFDASNGSFNKVKASSYANWRGTVGYPYEVFDGNKNTSWQDGDKNSYGVNEWLLSYNADGSTELISSVTVYNGYQNTSHNTSTKDFYKLNSRVKDFSLEFDDGKILSFTLSDIKSPQTFDFGETIETCSVKFKIKSVYEGDAYGDTCLSEIIYNG